MSLCILKCRLFHNFLRKHVNVKVLEYLMLLIRFVSWLCYYSLDTFALVSSHFIC